MQQADEGDFRELENNGAGSLTRTTPKSGAVAAAKSEGGLVMAAALRVVDRHCQVSVTKRVVDVGRTARARSCFYYLHHTENGSELYCIHPFPPILIVATFYLIDNEATSCALG
jgi:hypothetical protein